MRDGHTIAYSDCRIAGDVCCRSHGNCRIREGSRIASGCQRMIPGRLSQRTKRAFVVPRTRRADAKGLALRIQRRAWRLIKRDSSGGIECKQTIIAADSGNLNCFPVVSMRGHTRMTMQRSHTTIGQLFKLRPGDIG